MSADAPDAALVHFLLASVRTSALLLTAPVFSHPAVPIRLRVALALVLAWVLAPAQGAAATALPLAGGGLTAATLGEALVGATLGFATRLVFAGFGLLGEFVSVQSGLGAATVLDPSNGTSSGALSVLFELIAVLVWFALDGHHALLRGAALSFAALPVGAGAPEAQAFANVTALGSGVFEIAVRLAAPLTAAALLSNLALGILGRLVPQLNLMLVQLPAHVALGFALLALGAASLVDGAAAALGPWSERALAALGGGG